MTDDELVAIEDRAMKLPDIHHATDVGALCAEVRRLRSALEAIRAFGPTEPVGTGPTTWDIASAALLKPDGAAR